MGEGWLLAAEMCDLIESGTPNIVVCSPFACLPNHVVGKSVIKRLRQMHPESYIVAVDYDPGASEVNQLNRIKLMISVAKENFREGHPESFKIVNPDDPVTNDTMPAMRHIRRPGELEDSIIREGSKATGAYAAYGETVDAEGGKTYGYGEGAIHLTPEQLEQIEEAKRKAGVK